MAIVQKYFWFLSQRKALQVKSDKEMAQPFLYLILLALLTG